MAFSRKFSIFISSTYEDLKAERQAERKQIMTMCNLSRLEYENFNCLEFEAINKRKK